jgi:hypothetical protein
MKNWSSKPASFQNVKKKKFPFFKRRPALYTGRFALLDQSFHDIRAFAKEKNHEDGFSSSFIK